MIIHSLESMAAVDGQGIRYDVFFTGCPLRCAYCHNPDTWNGVGTEYTAEKIYKKVRRYKPYFKNGGGVTFSGGEPLLNADNINDINEFLVKDDIGYCLDTSGSVALTDSVKNCIDNADMVILDLKFWNDANYLKYTGKDMKDTLNFLKYLAKTSKRTWIRTVVVPGINDSEEILDKYLEILKSYNFIEKYELLGFHTMGFFKYDELDIENPLKDKEALDTKKLQKLQNYVNEKRATI